MGVNMEAFWSIYMILVVVYTIILLPLCICFESQDFEKSIINKFLSSLCSYFTFLALLIALLVAIYVFSGFVVPIPVQVKIQSFAVIANSSDVSFNFGVIGQNYPQEVSQQIEYFWIFLIFWKNELSHFYMTGSILDCLIGSVGVGGWFLMSLYLGTGLVYLPYKLIFWWVERPRRLDKVRLENLRKGLASQLEAKIKEIEKIRGKEKNKKFQLEMTEA